MVCCRRIGAFGDEIAVRVAYGEKLCGKCAGSPAELSQLSPTGNF